jgi:hypothetical protein
MMRLAMSPAAAGLLRGLIRRGGCSRDRILLTEHKSIEWQSLTFIGERHQLTLRIAGADAGEIARRITTGLGDAEFAIRGHVVADIACEGEQQVETDGSVTLRIEALTIED